LCGIVCVILVPAAGPNVAPGWYRIDDCNEARTDCAVTVFWQVKLVTDLVINLYYTMSHKNVPLIFGKY